MSEYQWKAVSAVGFDELMEALERADRKGYMPDAVKEAWEGFNWKPAQQQEEEPVAWANPNDLKNFDMKVRTNGGPLHTVPLYTSPQPSKPWVGLSNDEIYDMYNEPRSDAEMVEFARAIEAKLKEKNT